MTIAHLAIFAAATGDGGPAAPAGIGIWPVLAGGGILVLWYYLHQISRRLETIAERLARPEPVAAPIAPVGRAPEPVADGDLPPETVAVIAAAVHAAFGQPVRIVAIADASDALRTWSMEGRRQIFASHQVR